MNAQWCAGPMGLHACGCVTENMPGLPLVLMTSFPSVTVKASSSPGSFLSLTLASKCQFSCSSL